eukprot:g11176.t1
MATESRETGDRITKENLSNDDAVGSVRVDRSEPADGRVLDEVVEKQNNRPSVDARDNRDVKRERESKVVKEDDEMNDEKIDHDEEIDENNPPGGSSTVRKSDDSPRSATSIIRNKVIDIDEDELDRFARVDVVDDDDIDDDGEDVVELMIEQHGIRSSNRPMRPTSAQRNRTPANARIMSAPRHRAQTPPVRTILEDEVVDDTIVSRPMTAPGKVPTNFKFSDPKQDFEEESLRSEFDDDYEDSSTNKTEFKEENDDDDERMEDNQSRLRASLEDSMNWRQMEDSTGKVFLYNPETGMRRRLFEEDKQTIHIDADMLKEEEEMQNMDNRVMTPYTEFSDFDNDNRMMTPYTNEQYSDEEFEDRRHLPYRSDFSSNESVEGERQPKNGTGADAVDMNDRTRFLSPSPLRRVDDDGQLYSRRSPKKGTLRRHNRRKTEKGLRNMLNDGDLRKENYGNDSKKFYAKGRSKIDALNAPRDIFQADNPMVHSSSMRKQKYRRTKRSPSSGARNASNGTALYLQPVRVVVHAANSRGIAFRDLKPENIMIHTDGYVKVCDFGLAKNLRGGSTFTLCGTPAYAAPEVYKVEGHGTSCDWWTLGILVHELLYGSPPFRGKNANDVFNELQEYEYFYPRVQFPKGFKQHETSFVKRLLHPNPRKRLGYGKTGSNNVMKHKFFMTLDFDKLERKAYVAPHVPKIEDCYDTSNFGKKKDDFERTITPAPKHYNHEAWCARF